MPSPEDAMTDFEKDVMRPRHIFINGIQIDPTSEQVHSIIKLLRLLIDERRLGHPEGFEVLTAKEMIEYFG